jgi:excisionase family DNA binding protein
LYFIEKQYRCTDSLAYHSADAETKPNSNKLLIKIICYLEACDSNAMNDEILTIKHVAVYLKVNEWTIYRLSASGRIPAFKVGNSWRFKQNPNRIEIWNSGRLLPVGWKPADLIKNHPSYPPNPDIAHALYIRDLMKRIGRGTQKIINACREHRLRTPKWQDAPAGVTLTMFSDNMGHTAEVALNDRQKALMNSLLPDTSLKLADYRAQFVGEVSERQARRDLKESNREWVSCRSLAWCWR